jgi:hypothetical protein
MNDWTFDVIIDELVLYGAAVIDRDRFRAQVELELERILQQEGGLPDLAAATNGRVVEPPPAITVFPGQTPTVAQVARAIHGAIKR